MKKEEMKRDEVFKNRTSLDEFDIDNPDSLDAWMLKRMEDIPVEILRVFKFNTEYVLKCFNNAYRITILILKDKRPAFNIDKYIGIAESAAPHRDGEYALYDYLFLESMTMAMVVNYLRACEPKTYAYDNRNALVTQIYNHHYDKLVFNSLGSDAPTLFFKNVLRPETIKKLTVDKDLFYPQLPLAEKSVEEEIEQRKTRIKELEEENAKLKKENEELRNIINENNEWYIGTDYTKMSEEEKLFDREKIVFFTTVLSTENDKKYTVLSNLATFIETMCKGSTSNIETKREKLKSNLVPMISKMKKPEYAKANAKAAKKVAGLLSMILPDEYKNDRHKRINQIIESMKLNYPEDDEQ